jgi:molybdate transport system ATP-binding protein
VEAVASELKPDALIAKIRASRRNKNSPPFVLDLSAEVPAGITILFGPSGAGKSTLLDCIVGLVRPEEGRIALGEKILFDAETRVDLPPQQRKMGYLFQSAALFPHMSVEENVAYGLEKVPANVRQEQVREILEAFRVEGLRTRKPGEISGGEAQRVALARSLVTGPRALLLDEPLTGLDAELKSAIVDDLRAWNAAKRIPILYVTHSREEVDALGERVIALENGRVVSSGAPMDVLDVPWRKRLAKDDGLENLVAGNVLDLRQGDGVMCVRLGETACEIEVPLGYAAVGDRLRVVIRAGDILLATEQPRGLSARNLIEGQITSLERRGTMVIARVDCGVTFLAHVTPGAARSLELTAGRKVWLVLKTHSCHVVD